MDVAECLVTPRDYQVAIARELWRALVKDKLATLMVAPTAAGKTIIASYLIRQVVQHLDWRVLVLSPKREIVHQTAQKLYDCGIAPGIIMSGDPMNLDARVQVASIQTYLRWRGRRVANYAPDLIVHDESHGAMSRTVKTLVEDYRGRGSALMGMTATPIRSDGQGLGRLFEKMVMTPDVAELTAMGFLVPMEYYVGIVPDVTGIKLTAGDYSADELQAVLDKDALIGDVVDNYGRLARGRKALLFASGVRHSLHLRDRLRAAGIRAEHIDGDTPRKERDLVHDRLNRGEVDVVTNANVYVEGTDLPIVSCIIDAQPTKSVGRYLQKAGRGLRTHPGKDNCYYLDHAGNVYEHGRVEMPRTWLLTKGREMRDLLRAARDEKDPLERACDQCGLLYTGTTCPVCGAERPELHRMVNTVGASLEKLGDAKKGNAMTEAERMVWYAQALAVTRRWGKRDGMAAYAYEAKFGTMPPRSWFNIPTRKPTDDVESYMRSRLIRASKRVKAWSVRA